MGLVKHVVTFRYADDEPSDYDGEEAFDSEQTVSFDTEAEANAFEDGLTYGDEPQYVVISIGVVEEPVADRASELASLEAAFEEAGGRGVELAERIDTLRREQAAFDREVRRTRDYDDGIIADDDH